MSSRTRMAHAVALCGSLFIASMALMAASNFPRPQAEAAGSTTLVISELRLRGPNGLTDEYIEVQNVSGAAMPVPAAGGGFALVASDGTARCTIPSGIVIPRFGHFLCTNSTANADYSLANYGGTGAAAGNQTYTTDIPDDRGIALFNNASTYSLANRIDAVGPNTEPNSLYREGAGFAPINTSAEHALVRNLSTPSVSEPALATATPGVSEDTDDNSTDFVLVSPAAALAGSRNGAPGPENMNNPIPNGKLTVGLLDPCKSADAAPNAVRSLTQESNATYGTVSVRRTITNTTGVPVTRLRLRLADARTTPAPPGTADMRALTSSAAPNVTTSSPQCLPITVPVVGTTLEAPPAQPSGGGFNSTLSVGGVTTVTPLAVGDSINVSVLLGLNQSGLDGARLIVEATSPGSVAAPPKLTCIGMTDSPATITSMCPPTAVSDSYTTSRDTALTVPAASGVLSNDRSSTADVLSVIPETRTPTHGSVVVNADGSFVYTPPPGFLGVASFDYRNTDANGNSTAASVTITVEAPAVTTTTTSSGPSTSAPGTSSTVPGTSSTVPGTSTGPGSGTAPGASRFVPLAPVRFLDTRDADGVTAGAPVGADGTIDLQIAGRVGIPGTGVTAVVLDLTAAGALAPGYVTVWPHGQPRPLAANLNISAAGQNIANLVTVAVGDAGRISLYAQSGTHLIADVAGYYTPVDDGTGGGRYRALSPARILDTREAHGIPTMTPVPPNATIDVQVTGRGGVPDTGLSAVVLSLAAADATAPGYVTVWPKGAARPLASSLNTTFAGQNIQNAVIVPVGNDGQISLYSQSGTHLVLDVTGWFTDASAPASAAGLFVPASPVRILDTREANGVPGTTPLPPDGTIELAVTGRAGVPDVGAVAVVINLTAAEATAPGYISVWPGEIPRPFVSSINVTAAGQNIASLVTATLSAGGHLSFYSQSGAHLVADLAGYYTSS